MAARVDFDVRHALDAPARAVWEELTDWAGHGRWVPATRVAVDAGSPTGVGATFTAWTGLGPVALPDRMRVAACEWDDEAARGWCEVVKEGPVLRGRAGFTVSTEGEGSTVEWYERVTVPGVPQLLAPLLASCGAAVFRVGMRRLARRMPHRTDG